MNPTSLCFAFHQNELLIDTQNLENPIPTYSAIQSCSLNISRMQEIGQYRNGPCYALDVEIAAALPNHYEFQPLRQAALHILSPTLFQYAGKGMQILDWDKTHQFCSRCGKSVAQTQAERVKICPECQLTFYPRISPTIIVAIKRDNKILLARSPHFKEKMYSILAGFIEPGESAEDAVHREVKEEVGIEIQNLRYQLSQPWPFSNSLMLGFTGDYKSGEIVVDGVEISEANWYSKDALPQLPTPISISRKLIDMFIHQETI
jgi:NAD+ diphosphatase